MASPNMASRPVVVYIMAFMSKQVPPPMLQQVCRLAQQQLSAKDSIFQQRFSDALASKGKIEVSQQPYASMMSTPQTMQTTMMGWLKGQYNAEFTPVTGENFFPHGIQDPEGRSNFVLFYFPKN